MLCVVFSDELFKRSDARELLEPMEIRLKDDFEVENNRTSYLGFDFYHSFTLSISAQDKQRVIDHIKSDPWFQSGDMSDRPPASAGYRSYETRTSYVTEYHQTRKGHRSNMRSIEIPKTGNTLIYTDMDF